jgi:hypothetical protein
MVALVDRLQKEGTTRAEARRVKTEERPGRGRPRHFVFKYQPKGGPFSLALQFRKPQVPKEEVIQALEAILESLRRGE